MTQRQTYVAAVADDRLPPDDGSIGRAILLPRRGWGRRFGSARRAAPVAPPALADGMLKLMLILLAFFVFLHSRSEFAERKVVPILDSLALRFAAAVPQDGHAEAAALALRGQPGAQLRRRLLGHLPISAAAIEAPGALVAFDLDEAALFEPAGEAVLRERLVLLHRLTGAIAAATAEGLPLLVVTTAWPDGDAGGASKRFSALLASLADTPLALTRIRFGFADQPDGSWRFVVRSDGRDAP